MCWPRSSLTSSHHQHQLQCDLSLIEPSNTTDPEYHHVIIGSNKTQMMILLYNQGIDPHFKDSSCKIIGTNKNSHNNWSRISSFDDNAIYFPHQWACMEVIHQIVLLHHNKGKSPRNAHFLDWPKDLPTYVSLKLIVLYRPRPNIECL